VAGYKILIVEDDDRLRVGLRQMLERGGYTVFEAGTGGEALVRAEVDQPHLILLDLGLPDGDGLGFAQELRRRENTTRIPIAVLTGQLIRGRRAEILGSICVGAIPKPVTVERLHRDLRLLLMAGRRGGVRRFPRYPVDAPVFYRLVGSTDPAQMDFLAGVARTLGEGGMLLEVPVSLAASSQVELRVPLPTGEVTAVGKIVYSLRQGDGTAAKGGFHHGIQFTDMEPARFAALRRLIKAQPPAAR
jgi:two-component system KDP operon response regulator KdpE